MNRWHQICSDFRHLLVELVIAFENLPAVVFATFGGTCLVGDLFPSVLADVADAHVAVERIEAETPRVAHTIGPDLIAEVTDAHKGIVFRDSIRRIAFHVDIDAQHLAK